MRRMVALEGWKCGAALGGGWKGAAGLWLWQEVGRTAGGRHKSVMALVWGQLIDNQRLTD